jgi:hypothetical protein
MGIGNPKGTNRGGGTRPGRKKYIARPDGTIWVEHKNKCSIRTPTLHHSGYYTLDLQLPDGNGGSKRRSIAVHRYIAEQLLPNPDPKNLTVVDHINRNKTDNRLENLRWSSRHDNFWNSNFKIDAVIGYLKSLGYTVIPPNTIMEKN